MQSILVRVLGSSPRIARKGTEWLQTLTSKLCSSAARFLVPLCLSSSQLLHTCLCAFIPTFSHRLLIPNAPSSHSLPLFDPMFSPALASGFCCACFQFSTVCCFWSLCSASPQALILQLPFPILSPMNFSVDFFRSPAQLLLSGLSLLHPDLRKESPSFSVPISGATETWQDVKSGICTNWTVFRPHR